MKQQIAATTVPAPPVRSSFLSSILSMPPLNVSRPKETTRTIGRIRSAEILSADPSRPTYDPSFMPPLNPRRLMAAIICATVTRLGSYVTYASPFERLTRAFLTPSSLSKASFAVTAQAPHVIPETLRVTRSPASADGTGSPSHPPSAMAKTAARTTHFNPFHGRCTPDIASPFCVTSWPGRPRRNRPTRHPP